MKRMKVLFTAMMLFVAASAFATGEENVSTRVQEAFRQDFAAGNNVKWEKSNDFYFASFTLENTTVSAAYDEEGKLLGTSRSIRPSQLPLTVTLSLEKKYAGYKVSENVLELNFDGETRYYLSVYNEHELVSLKALSDGELAVEPKKK